MPGENIWDSRHIQRRCEAFYKVIDECYQDGTYTDVNIICENRVFRCHRIVLAAASEYFHLMFRGNFAESRLEDVVLHDIDSITFEQILLFVYRGEIATIDDENVFNLLRASDILRLKDVEDLCVHYLTQKNIPMDCCLEIYLFASALRKVALISATSRFILQNLDRFSEENKFLEISFEDFSTLLTYFQSSSTSRDERLLQVILGWVCRSTDNHKNRKSSFMELAQKVQFKSLSPAHVAEYFNRNSVDGSDESLPSEVSETSNFVSNMDINDLSLHLYIGNFDRLNNTHHLMKQISIFSLQENVDEGIDWSSNFSLQENVDEDDIDIDWSSHEKMRIVESHDRLYYLRYYNERCAFSSSTAYDLCTKVHSLTLPSTLISMTSQVLVDTFRRMEGTFSLCSLRKNIYLSGLPGVGIQYYNPELDIWSPIPILSEYENKNLVNDDTRLFMLDRRDPYCGLSLHAYDPRVGKVETLYDFGISHILKSTEPGCYHKGKIYWAEDYYDRTEHGSSLKIAIYDPVADRWDVRNLSTRNIAPGIRGRRMLSFNDRLWIFTITDDGLFTHVYDSYLQDLNEKKYFHCFSHMDLFNLFDGLVSQL